MKQLTKIEVIDMVVEHYGKDPLKNRSLGIGQHGQPTCKYNGENNTHCAFAMFVRPEMRSELIEGKDVQFCMRNRLLTDFLKPEVVHINNALFWYSMQRLHDTSNFWNFVSGGLTEVGKAEVEALKKQYSE